MAEEKKDKGKDKGKEKKIDSTGDAKTPEGVFTDLVWIIFLIILAWYVLKSILAAFGYVLFGPAVAEHVLGTATSTTPALTPIFTTDVSGLPHELFSFLFSTVEVLSVFISFLLILGIIYAIFKKSQTEKFAKATEVADERKAEAAEAAPQVNRKWLRVIDHLNSPNPGDWRLCILEADIMLNELLEKQQYVGASIGDKLKTASRGDFKTLDFAWEAHKIRNAIAHEGADFSLPQNEAKRVINLYKAVFEEFYFI
jgi:hypothetical protein